MIKKGVFENDLIAGMQTELQKQASDKTPELAKAAECLHAALEILEAQGLETRADQVLQILQKIAANTKLRPVIEMPAISKLMEAGLTQRDLQEFSRGSPIARAKLNLVLRHLGLSEHHIGKLLGPHNVMSEEEAKQITDPNRSYSKIYDAIKNPTGPDDPAEIWPGQKIEFESIAQKKSDPATKGLTSEKQVKNLKEYGIPLNVTKADDNLADANYEKMLKDMNRPHKLSKEDVDPDLAGLLDIDSFDIDASDDELMGMEVQDDSLEVFDDNTPMSDFEDEKG